MEEFLNMGGYGAFIWPSYGISFLILAFLVVLSFRRLRRIERTLKPLEQDRRARRRRPAKRENATP